MHAARLSATQKPAPRACRPCSPTRFPIHPVRGLAALTVVMALFFVMALAAAYTNRSIVFEQRMSAASLRAERAIAVADAAVDWTLNMLNGGRIDAGCKPSINVANNAFRSRYLAIIPNSGGYSVNGYPDPQGFPGCQVNGTVLNCVCPAVGTGDVPIVGGTETDAAFRVSFLLPVTGAVAQSAPPGTIVIQVRGCSNPGSGAGTCYGTSDVPNVDAKADVRANIGMVRALPAPPQAPVTSGGDISAAAVVVNAANRDNPTGLVLHAGGAVTTGGGTTLSGPAGSTGVNTKLENDSVLADMKAKGTFFDSLFGMPRAMFKALPGVVAIDCGAVACDLASLEARNWLTQFAGKVVYVDGDLDIGAGAPANIGSDAFPVMLVVAGNLTVSTSSHFVGFLYGKSITWSAAANAGSVRGAMIAAEQLQVDGNLTAAYDAAVLKAIQVGYGAYVRVPGGWNRGGI